MRNPDAYERKLIALQYGVDPEEVFCVAAAISPGCWDEGASTIGAMAARSRSITLAAAAIRAVDKFRSRP